MSRRGSIAAHEDHCPQGSLRGQKSLCRYSKCRCARGHIVCAPSHALSHLGSVWEKLYRSMCCRALCGYGYSTWMLQDNRTVFILQHKKCRVKPTGGKKPKFLFSVFNLQVVLYYCCVFNFVVNYPIIIIIPCNWYCKNAQFLNRMTGHYSPKSTVWH